MQTLEIFKQLNEYNIWANAEFMQYFLNAKLPDKKAVQVFAHLLLAEKIWLQRITGENKDNTGADFWAGETNADCVNLFDENQIDFGKFFHGLTEEKLARKFDYKNSKGASFQNTVGEALTHVLMHSGYHRGQAVQAIRLGNDEPPSSDFIQFLRQGK
jgi:uncharacterized damage-inducible protein DinB